MFNSTSRECTTTKCQRRRRKTHYQLLTECPINNIPNVDGTVWLIAMIQKAQSLDIERLSCLIDVDSLAVTAQCVNVACVDDISAIDFEAYAATAVRSLASYAIKKHQFCSVILSCRRRKFCHSRRMTARVSPQRRSMLQLYDALQANCMTFHHATKIRTQSRPAFVSFFPSVISQAAIPPLSCLSFPAFTS